MDGGEREKARLGIHSARIMNHVARIGIRPVRIGIHSARIGIHSAGLVLTRPLSGDRGGYSNNRI